ncbi:flagellar motor protein MotB [Salinisphaera sp. SPP-AMP-43]|uniref:flagellar motor protein MotB n=1 Tax=Salinisphaera sp. SPP-AMP-43 TaxID=3121288 RepID=UPI003C6E030A
MSGANKHRPIVVKRHKPHRRHGSHGTWKIAYADFMTAMMAFFLVMWLLSGLSQSQLENVSEYFRTPLKVALVGGDKQSASNSAIPGGGDDPVHSNGEVALTTPRAANYNPDTRRLEQLRAKLQAQIEQDPKLNRMSSQLRIAMVRDGLRIQIFDSKRRPMFELGSAQLEPDIALLLHRIGPTLNKVDNKITLTGHTDDLAYASGPQAYSNWELSADRANAARRALIVGGMQTGKLLRVIGASDTEHVMGDKPASPLNRRISILLLNDQAQNRIESMGQTIKTRKTLLQAQQQGGDLPAPPAAEGQVTQGATQLGIASPQPSANSEPRHPPQFKPLPFEPAAFETDPGSKASVAQR